MRALLLIGMLLAGCASAQPRVFNAAAAAAAAAMGPCEHRAPIPATLYINLASGSDSNLCNPESPCRTVTGALKNYPGVGSYDVAVTFSNSYTAKINCVNYTITTRCNLLEYPHSGSAMANPQ